MNFDFHRWYKRIVSCKPVDDVWINFIDIGGHCIQDIEMVSVSYIDYCDGDVCCSGNEDMSIERFLQLKSHTYTSISENGFKESITFMCRDESHRALAKMLRENLESRGYIVKPVSKKREGVLYVGRNCRINQFWNGDLEIILHGFIGTVIKLNGSHVLGMIYQLLNADLTDLGLKLVSKEGYNLKYSYKNGKIITITKENIKDLINKQKTILKVVE